MVLAFVKYMRGTLKDYDAAIMKSRLFKARTVGIGAISLAEAVEWGATGPFLRACGLEWDLRKKRPYGGYERFDFDIPTAKGGDSYDRLAIHVEEMRQSLRIIEQCVKGMPGGAYKADHPLAVPPPKERTMHDIETLIDHFLGVSWGPNIPPGEACATVEGTKGQNSYYLVSRRRRHVLPDADPHPLLRPHPDGAHDVEGLTDIRPRRDPGLGRLRPRGRGQVRPLC